MTARAADQCAEEKVLNIDVRKDSYYTRHVIWACALADCYAGIHKDEFCDALATHTRTRGVSDFVVIGGDFSAQVGNRSMSRACIDERSA